MDVLNLFDKVSFPAESPRKELIFDSENMRVVLLNLEKGQEIPPHTSPSEVLMLLMVGKGKFVVGDRVEEVGKGAMVVCKRNESHGIQAEERMTVLAVISPSPL